MKPESWEQANAAHFDGRADFDFERYCQTGAIITINAEMDYGWVREKIAEHTDGKPALLLHVSCKMLYRGGTDTSRWRRFQNTMAPHLIRDGAGNPVPWPGYEEYSDAMNPASPGMWEDFSLFWKAEYYDAAIPEHGPTGIYLDDANDWYPGPALQMGFTEEAWRKQRDAFRAGRSWFIRQLRKSFPDIVIVTNWAKTKTTPDYLKFTDGVTVEGKPLVRKQFGILYAQLMKVLKYNIRHWFRRRKAYLASWNDPDAARWPFIQHGSHWEDRQ
jgi:hypothetical protein